MRLKELRKNERLTQTEIAKILDMPLMTYNNYENKKNEPTIATLCKLADFYGVSLDYLVGRNFTYEVGYLTENQKTIIAITKDLSDYNQVKLIGMAQGLLISQE